MLVADMFVCLGILFRGGIRLGMEICSDMTNVGIGG